MIFRIFPILSLLLMVGHRAVAEGEQDADVIRLREVISKVVDVQTMESKERADWKVAKEEINALLELHTRELALLDEELSKAGNSAAGHEEATAEMKARIEGLKRTRSLVAEAVARHIPRVQSMAKSFPGPLLRESEVEMARVAAWKPSDEPRDALRAILDVLGKAEQFNRRFTRSTEVVDGLQVEVLYLGLGRAFYMGPKDVAGVGRPLDGRWVWEPNPAIRGELVNAFQILEKKMQPAMVTLPLEIR